MKLRLKELKADLREEIRHNFELQQTIDKLNERDSEQAVRLSNGAVDSRKDYQDDSLENAKLLIIEKEEELRRKDEEITQLRQKSSDLEQTIEQQSDSPERVNKIASLEAKIVELVEEKTQMISRLQSEETAAVAEKDQRISQLVGELETAQNDLREARNRIQELGEKEEEINNLHSVIAELRSSLATAKKEKEESEWHLGEHKEWLSNSKEKVAYLQNQLNILNDPDRLAVLPSSPKMRPILENLNADESAKAQVSFFFI
ncbi:hypothetical protein DICVIV_11206 [Dictyocaulus viviparus]|uniref:Uncharacterized protein n=1 Tax=Dictyocaulus viviparus TaxID=29172 RepID=A0A0D8XKF5_DICVI|nr:hypothetical protein DICVIV_11206 [Dictyocaulus viviparus]